MDKKIKDVRDLVNWRMLSLQLAGNQSSIRKENIPKKYVKKVTEVLTSLSDLLSV